MHGWCGKGLGDAANARSGCASVRVMDASGAANLCRCAVHRGKCTVKLCKWTANLCKCTVHRGNGRGNRCKWMDVAFRLQRSPLPVYTCGLPLQSSGQRLPRYAQHLPRCTQRLPRFHWPLPRFHRPLPRCTHVVAAISLTPAAIRPRVCYDFAAAVGRIRTLCPLSGKAIRGVLDTTLEGVCGSWRRMAPT